MTARCPLVAALLASALGTALAAPIPKQLRAKASKIDTARFKVNYTDAPFDKLFEDFADGTGLKLVGEVPIRGTVTLKPNRECNAAHFIDLLNEVLGFQKHTLVRHGDTFYLHPSDQPIDRDKVDTVTADELKVETPKRNAQAVAVGKPNGWAGAGNFNGWPGLGQVQAGQVQEPPPPKRGRTEVVRHVLQLPDGLKAKDVRPQVKRILSPTGVVEDGKNDDELVVTDRAANVRAALALGTEKSK